jgi:hypothetical protein
MTETKEDQLQVRACANHDILELTALNFAYPPKIVFKKQSFRFSAVSADMQDVGTVLEHRRANVGDPDTYFFLHVELVTERRRLNRSVYRLNFFRSS